MKKFCGHGISKSTLPILLKFLSGLDEVIPCGQKFLVWDCSETEQETRNYARNQSQKNVVIIRLAKA